MKGCGLPSSIGSGAIKEGDVGARGRGGRAALGGVTRADECFGDAETIDMVEGR
jgi:hypothetical protein